VQLDARLFERSRTFVRLTPAGEALLDHARRWLLQAHRMMDAVKHAEQGATGALGISFVPSASLLTLPPVVQAFRGRFPGVTLELMGDTSARQIVALEQQRVHLSIVVGPLPPVPHLRVTPLQQAPFVVAVPATHALARQEQVQLSDLAAQTFVQLPMTQAPAYTATLLGACQRAGFTPRIVQEASPFQTVLTLVGCGVGVSLVPASMRMLALPTVKYLTIADQPAPCYELAIATLADEHNRLAERFIELATQLMGPYPVRTRAGTRSRSKDGSQAVAARI